MSPSDPTLRTKHSGFPEEEADKGVEVVLLRAGLGQITEFCHKVWPGLLRIGIPEN